VTLQLTVPSTISASWTIHSVVTGKIELYVFPGNPFSSQANPTSTQPPNNSVASAKVDSNLLGLVTVVTPSEPPGTYTVYLFKRGLALPTSSDGSITYWSGNCS
jgi:hypothetical protein